MRSLRIFFSAQRFQYGGIAQLGERLNGIQEVSGSIPLISTIKGKHLSKTCSFGSRFSLCHKRLHIQSEAELLKVDVEVDMQLVIPVNLNPLDKAVDDHLLCFQTGRVVHIGP